MNLIRLKVLVLITIIIASCNGSSSVSSFHMDKKNWNVSDYNTALKQIRYVTPKDQKSPNLDDPTLAPVFKQLTNKKNISLAVNKKGLKAKERFSISEKYLEIANDILKVYTQKDASGKYIYPNELVSAIDFDLHAKYVHYKLEKIAIRKEYTNPDAPNTKKLIAINAQAIADHYMEFLKILETEDAFKKSAVEKYAHVIKNYFPKIIKNFPQADYSNFIYVTKKIKKKSSTSSLKDSLDLVIKTIKRIPKQTEES